MKTIIVRYKVKPDRLAEHLALIDRVFLDLDEARPDGLAYDVLRLDDGVSFLHTATLSADVNPLLAMAAFQNFTADIKNRCDEPPTSSVGTVVRAYNPGRAVAGER